MAELRTAGEVGAARGASLFLRRRGLVGILTGPPLTLALGHPNTWIGERKGINMGKGLLLWLLGVPGGIVILLYLFGVLR